MKTTSRFAIAAAAGMLLGGYALQAQAADLGGDCCADLEERVAELEATTVRKGNRVVSLTISGQVNKHVMWWDDGHESNVYVGDNSIGESRFRLAGSATIDPDVSMGYYIEVRVGQFRLGHSADQNTHTGTRLVLDQSYWWLQSRKWGRLSVGHLSPALDGVSALSLGNTVGNHADKAWNNSFFLHLSGSGGVYPGVVWGDLRMLSYHSGTGAGFVRYDSPTLHGFVISATWGGDDYWDVAVRYAKEWNSIRVAAAIGYAEQTHNGTPLNCFGPGQTAALPNSVVSLGTDNECNLTSGSVSVMHVPSGIFVNFAAGEMRFKRLQALADATGFNYNVDTSDDFWHVAVGIDRRWWAYGNTSLYGEWGGVNTGFNPLAGAVANIQAETGDFAGANHVGSSKLRYWGLGLVQKVDAAAADFYLMYRKYDAKTNLFTNNGDNLGSPSWDDMSLLSAGAIIRF